MFSLHGYLHMQKNISPWAAAANQLFKKSVPASFRGPYGDIYLQNDALWLLCEKDLAIRIAYSPGGELKIESNKKNSHGIDIHLSSIVGEFKVSVNFIDEIFHYTLSITPMTDLFIPFWPRDVVVNTEGEIFVIQVGTRSGLVFANSRINGALLYFQNLSSLADYNNQTETSCADVVGGEWPEIGLALPPTKDKPLKKRDRSNYIGCLYCIRR